MIRGTASDITEHSPDFTDISRYAFIARTWHSPKRRKLALSYMILYCRRGRDA